MTTEEDSTPGARANEATPKSQAPPPLPRPEREPSAVQEPSGADAPAARRSPLRGLQKLPGSSWVWVVMAASSGALAALLLLQQLTQRGSSEAGLPQLSLLGKPLELDRDAPSRALDRLRQHVNGLFTLEVPHAEAQRVSYGDLGVEIDKARLAQLLRDSVDRTSPLSRWRRKHGLAASEVLELPVPLRMDVERVLPLLLGFKDEFDRPAVDARLDLPNRRVSESVEGLLLDVDASLLAIQHALAQGKSSAHLVFEHVAPRRRTEQLANVRFDHVLASFETTYDRSMKAAARTYNLRLAASKLDGTVLFPNEVFDFNHTVGARDEANGYKVAPVIAQGELVDGIGGGTCQISGTLHGAAFFAGLQMVERYAHTRPSSYIKLGLDATVVYPTINFRFRNPFDFPVVLHQTVKDGVVRAEILGPKTEGTVTLIRRITGATPYEQLERPDPNVPEGERVLGQRGMPGFRVKVYRILRDGPHAEREVWEALYPPTSQIVRVGTGPKGTKLPPDDPHGEYTADELLVMTLDRAKSAESPTHSEQRDAGRFGVMGWTAKAGMPVFERN